MKRDDWVAAGLPSGTLRADNPVLNRVSRVVGVRMQVQFPADRSLVELHRLHRHIQYSGNLLTIAPFRHQLQDLTPPRRKRPTMEFSLWSRRADEKFQGVSCHQRSDVVVPLRHL